MLDTRAPIEIFCSYASEDERSLEELERALNSLQREELISIWHGCMIVPGEGQQQAIDFHLSRAQIILLLISPHFIASDQCYIEMMHAIERSKKDGTRVIPILLRVIEL
jgi:hypothetical protein